MTRNINISTVAEFSLLLPLGEGVHFIAENRRGEREKITDGLGWFGLGWAVPFTAVVSEG